MSQLPRPAGRMFKHEQGWLGTRGPTVAQGRQRGLRPPRPAPLGVGVLIAVSSGAPRRRARGAGRATTEPTGLGPSVPVLPGARLPGAPPPSWVPGRGQTLLRAPLGGSAACGRSGLWNGDGSRAPSCTVAQGRQCVPPGAPPGAPPVPPARTPASSASAPGVPGGSASAEAVAALPGAVDEAQGVLELLGGGFVNGLVREVHLRGACRDPVRAVSTSLDSPALRGGAAADDGAML